MSLDSPNRIIPQGPGGGSSAPAGRVDSTQRDVFPKPDANSGGDETGANRVPSVSKPETPGQIDSVFYDRCTDGASPGSLDSTLNDVLQVSFGK